MDLGNAVRAAGGGVESDIADARNIACKLQRCPGPSRAGGPGDEVVPSCLADCAFADCVAHLWGMAHVMDAVGIIGVGRMGLPVCATLVRNGFTVTASDVRPEAQKAVLACGARWGGTCADVAAASDIVIRDRPPAGGAGLPRGRAYSQGWSYLSSPPGPDLALLPEQEGAA